MEPGANLRSRLRLSLPALTRLLSLWDGVGFWIRIPFSWYKFIPTPGNLKTWSEGRWVKKFAQDLVAKRRKELAESDDKEEGATCLLDALIKARDDVSGAKLTESQVIDNVVLLFFASFETTGNSLAFMCHFLANNPRVQEKLYAELSELADDFEHWTDQKKILTAVESLPYLENCIKEAARLLPVAPGVPRTSTENLALGEYHLEKKTVVVLNTMIMGRDPTLWNSTTEDIEKFRPERWDEAASFPDLKNSYLPFGSGGRMCVGFRIANLEMKTIIAMLLRAYKLSPNPAKPLDVIGDMTISPKHGCSMFLEPRHK